MPIPRALPHEPTTLTSWVEVVWEETQKVQLSGPMAVDASDGVPVPVEAERSATVAIAVVDLAEAFDALVELARRDRVPFDIMPLRVDPKTTRFSIVDVLQLTGQERVEFVPRAVGVSILDWRRFQGWLPGALKEAERGFFRTMDSRKATAVMFRLRCFAQMVAQYTPPNGANHDVLHVE